MNLEEKLRRLHEWKYGTTPTKAMLARFKEKMTREAKVLDITLNRLVSLELEIEEES